MSLVVAVPAAAAPADLSGARWIWYPEGSPAVSAPAETRYFRRTFTQPAGQVGEARLTVTGDDTVDVWLNGEPLAASARGTDSWQRALTVDLRSALVTGTNTLAIAVRNTSAGPAGLVARARIVTGGAAADLVTDGAWKAGRNAGEGWERPGFADGSWPQAADLGSYGAEPWGSRVTTADPGEASPLSVTSTTTERRVAPLGVDAKRPRFGWVLGSSAPGQRQGSYQVLVASTRALADAGTGDVWDSGRVDDERSVDVVYGGPALTSLTGYHWRVRVWDTQGRAGAWSAVSTFETGLYNPASEWRGAFIGGPAGQGLDGATWIWYPEGSPTSGLPVMTRYFRKTFTLPSATTGTLAVTADDTATVWLNGEKIYSSPQVADSWKRAGVIDLSGRLRSGANTIAVSSSNTSDSPTGLVAKLTAGGVVVHTDGSWKASTASPAGWEQPAFDDGSWPQARALVGIGGAPWNDQVVVPQPAPLLRKGFSVTKAVRSARLVTTALGLHETQLNGAKVGEDVLAPAWTDYNKRVQYKVHDVTGKIRQGDNALGAWLGNGWYSGSLGIGGNRLYGTQPWYSAQLRLTYVDGTTETVATDGTWKYKSGPIIADDLYHGEHYDARLAVPGWDGAGFNDSGWRSAQVKQGALPNLVAQVDAGTKVQQDLRPVALTQPKPGTWVFDLGQNFTGWNRLRVQGPAGTTITLRHAEVLNPDGTLYTTNLRAAQVTDQVVLAGTGQAETFEPRFTVHGYRYVELTGFPGTPTLDTLIGRAAWTNGAEIGGFDTSDTMLDKLQNAIVWGQRSNMLYVPTDCPQRDERLGWTGDIASFAPTSTHNMDVSAFLDKFTDDMVDAQRSDGAFTDVAPNVSNMGAGTAAWGDAGVIVPYTLWQRYGDLRVVEDNFAAMTKWVDYLRSTAEADLIRDRGGFGDWLNVNDDTPRNVISTAYFAWSARLVSRMAQAIGRTAEASTYGTLADQVSTAFTNRLVAADGTVSGNTQTGYALALAFGLVPQQRVQSLVDKLVARVRAANNHLTVGFVGVSHLLQVLADHGRTDVAYQILTQPDYPGWGYMVNKGATTVWERWDGIRPDGSFQDPGMNSFNHYAMGSVGDFLYRTVGGLSSASPGFRSLVIAPKPGGGLTSAKSSHRTPYGDALSEWTTSGGRLTLHTVVPTGTSAVVRVPAASAAAVTAPPGAVPLGYGSGVASFHVPGGDHVFTAPA
ncbi:family 78 glycoside hydrolase catalytic domain [Lentzea sp. NPDC058436]|uniref:family 78 glycoside hydrolase catalytic domain n=1 Tax=Lentzea sp. NPDC058436 TaxID=3346499 RepID=UPI003650E4B6